MKQINRREMLRAIAIAAIVWVAILFVVARWQRGSSKASGSEPPLLHYPGTEGVIEQTSPNLGFRKYWFTLNEDFPSKSVYLFYQRELRQKGWHRLGRGEPQWMRQPAGDKSRDLLGAMWVSPDNLFQLELQMVSTARAVKQGDKTVGEERQPGIEVYVTLRRALNPSIFMQPKRVEETPERIEPARKSTE